MTGRDALRRLIALEGPLSVDRYMAFCLGDPVHGYYRRREPFGPAGDFTTAPEISQMFGELLGLWAAEVWSAMGAPPAVKLVELGPGRGTLMADVLRVSRALPSFEAAIEVHLVETSPVLRDRQRACLPETEFTTLWHDHFDAVPPGPAIVLANEFFDALPVRQFVSTPRGWCERLVGLGDEGLVFGLAAEPDRTLATTAESGAPPGAVLEWPAAGLDLGRKIAERLRQGGGAALIVDYGFEGPAFGDTLQAVSRHAPADPLQNPGEADLTVHVDFAALARAARQGGAAVYGPVTQRDFLTALGLEVRAARLKARAKPAQAEAIETARARLTAPGPTGMGELFKVLALADPALPPPPGLQAKPARPAAVCEKT